ncbi:hypothetical protein BKI52_25735 [marine bacterium AO1-C]|nr:hypothetical protein BKI52_25735 [marine bacterium AO1-C]
MFLTIVGIVLIVVGVILLIIGILVWQDRNKAKNKAKNIKAYETSSVADIVDIYSQLGDGLDGQYVGNVVELSGTIRSESPLKAEHSGQEVVYYHASVQHEYEESSIIKERDKDGKETEKEVTIADTEMVSSNKKYAQSYLEDASGAKILIDLRDSQMHITASLDEYRKEAPKGFVPSYGKQGSTKRYHYTEYVIPNNSPLYVLGQVAEKNGEVAIVAPKKDTKVDFIVSTSSEKELLESIEANAKETSGSALFIGITGLVLTVIGILLV